MKSIVKVLAIAVVLAGFGAVGQSAEAGLFGGGRCCRSSCCCRQPLFRNHCCRPVCCETSCCDSGCDKGCGGDCGCNNGCGGGCGCNGGSEVKAVEGDSHAPTPAPAAPEEAPKAEPST